jgi:DNA-binding NarL/FixJ family response regulator
MDQKLNIILADNQQLTQQGIYSILNEYFSSHANIKMVVNKEDLIQLLNQEQIHLLILDFDLINFDKLIELSELKKAHPSLGILIATNNVLPEDINTILDFGITNYVAKTCEKEELIEAVNATLNNRKYFSSDILNILLSQKTVSKNSLQVNSQLTNTEKEIVKHIAQGLTTKEIASKRNLSFHTIITHRKNIFRKLGINNSSELVLYAMRNGIIDTMEYYI